MYYVDTENRATVFFFCKNIVSHMDSGPQKVRRLRLLVEKSGTGGTGDLNSPMSVDQTRTPSTTSLEVASTPLLPCVRCCGITQFSATLKTSAINRHMRVDKQKAYSRGVQRQVIKSICPHRPAS